MDAQALDTVEVLQDPQVRSPAVSVVIPAYNRRDTLEAALRSVLAQTFQDFEIIVVDDGSDDDTVAVAAAVDDARIGILRHRQNAGPAAARNTGVQASSAPIVAFQDSDDFWLPEKLAAQLACLADPTVIASYCGMIVTGSPARDGEPPASPAYSPRTGFVSGDITAALLHSNIISTQTLVARRRTLLDIGLFDTGFKVLEDWELALRLAAAGAIVPAAAPHVVQRFSDNSLTRHSPRWAWDHRDILLKHHPLLQRYPAAGARQWAIAAGRFRRIGQPTETRAALRQARALTGLSPRLCAQYLRSFLIRSQATDTNTDTTDTKDLPCNS